MKKIIVEDLKGQFFFISGKDSSDSFCNAVDIVVFLR